MTVGIPLSFVKRDWTTATLAPGNSEPACCFTGYVIERLTLQSWQVTKSRRISETKQG
jgi:hypothetical protein